MKTMFPFGVRCLAAAALSLISAGAMAGGPDSNRAELRAAASQVDQLIIKFKPGFGRSAEMDSIAAQYGAKLSKFRDMSLGAQVFRLGKVMQVADADKLAAKLRALPGIELAAPDRIMLPDLTPNDALYTSNQWHYFEATGGMDANTAWDQGFLGQDVVVGVIDTGYRPHADLVANIVPGYDFISTSTRARDGNGRDNIALDEGDWVSRLISSSWHGTHVAGTIAAVTNNSIGVAGVAFRAKVQPLRALGKGGGTSSDIADAITWGSGGTVPGLPANATPSRVINMSLGGTGKCSDPGYQIYQTAIDGAVSRGTVVVVSAGNDNIDSANKSPASCNNVITVAATGRNGGKATYSNFGASVEVAAPGGSGSDGVMSTLNAGKQRPAADAYAAYQGTSMAAPHVAGVAAMMLSKNPSLTPAQILSILQSTARPFPAACNQCGSGIIDANAALNATP